MATNSEAMSFKNPPLINTTRDKIIDLIPEMEFDCNKNNDSRKISSSEFTKDQLWVIFSSMAKANVPNMQPFIETEYCDPSYSVGELGYLVSGWQFNLDLEYMILLSNKEKDYAVIFNELFNENSKMKNYESITKNDKAFTHIGDIMPVMFATINPILRYLLTACRFHRATMKRPGCKDGTSGYGIDYEEWRKLKLAYVGEVGRNFNVLASVYDTEKLYIYAARIGAAYDIFRGNSIRIEVDYSICKNPKQTMSFDFPTPDVYD